MTDLRPRPSKPAGPADRPVWRRPAVFWPVAILLVFLAVRLVTADEPEQATPVRPAPSSTVDSVQWPDVTGPIAAQGGGLPTAVEVEAPGRTFIAKLNLQPRMINGQVKGYIVRPDNPSILLGTPLQPGDVLLEVDGLALDPKRAASLAQNVGDYQDVFVRFERGSVERDGMLPLASR